MKHFIQTKWALCAAFIMMGASAAAQESNKNWEIKIEPALALNGKSRLKGPGLAFDLSRELKNNFRVELARSVLRFNSPGTWNPNGSKRYPSKTSSINFKTKSWELGVYKMFPSESSIRPIVGLGIFNRKWEETISMNDVSATINNNKGSSMGVMLSAGLEKSINENLNFHCRVMSQTNVHMYSIFSFRFGLGYRFGFM